MKKLIKTLALAFVAIATVSVFNSCEKEEDEGEVYHATPWNYKQSGFDPYYDEVKSLEVGDFTLRGDSVFADVTILYVKLNSSKVQTLSEQQFVGRNISRIRDCEHKFRLRNDSLFKVTISNVDCYDYMTSKDSVLSAISEYKTYRSAVSHYKYGCTITQKVVEEESFVKVVNNPFERYYNNFSRGEEFVFVYKSYYIDFPSIVEYRGCICPKSLLDSDDLRYNDVLPLEIVNY